MDIVWTVSSTLRQSSLVVEYKTWMLNVISSVADPEGVPWVPWNPSFEGLPPKFYAQTFYLLYAHTGAMHFSFNSSNNARVSTPVSRI